MSGGSSWWLLVGPQWVPVGLVCMAIVSHSLLSGSGDFQVSEMVSIIVKKLSFCCLGSGGQLCFLSLLSLTEWFTWWCGWPSDLWGCQESGLNRSDRGGTRCLLVYVARGKSLKLLYLLCCKGHISKTLVPFVGGPSPSLCSVLEHWSAKTDLTI